MPHWKTHLLKLVPVIKTLFFSTVIQMPCRMRFLSSGDLFLMPSSFEPCGISQMLAMRAGQPCLVKCGWWFKRYGN